MLNKLRILYAEDDDDLRRITSKVLEKYFPVIVVSKNNGQTAWQEYITCPQKYDCILTDIHMPVTNGLQFIEKIKNQDNTIPIIVMSVENDTQLLTKIIDLGVSGFIAKPYKMQQLEQTLNNVINSFFQQQKNKLLYQEKIQAETFVHEYKKAVDASTIFSIGDLQGKIKYANKQFEQISGYSLDELKNKPHSIIRHPQTPKETFKNMWETIQSKQVWKGIIQNRAKNGASYYVDATIVPIIDDYGHIKEYAGIRKDITKLIEKEREVKSLKDQQRYREVQQAMQIKHADIVKYIPFAALLLGHNNNILAYNKALNELFDFSFPLHKGDDFNSLLIKEAPFVYADSLFSLDERYELCSHTPIVGIKMSNILKICHIRLQSMQNTMIVSLFPKG